MMMDENQRTVEEYQVEEHRTKEISAESRRVKRNYERRDYLLALIMAAASFVYVRGSEFFSGAWLPLFTALFVSAGVFYLHSLGRRMDREGKISLFFLIAGAVWFLVKYLPGRQEWELQGIMPYVTLFLHGAGVYWLLTVSGARIKGVLDESCILDLGKGFFALPFMNFGEVFLAAAHGVKQFRSSDQETKKKQKDKAGQILFGVMMSIPVLVIVLPMLAGADESFSAFVGGLSNLCSAFIWQFIVESDGNSRYLLFLWPFLRSFSCKIHKRRRGASKRQPACRSALCGYDVFFIGGLRSLCTVFSGEVFRHSCESFFSPAELCLQ